MAPDDMARTHAAAFTQSRPWSRDEFVALLSVPGTFASGDARAFALARIIVDEVELLTIATDPAFQSQGLARRVMQAWMIEAMSRGAATAFLEVASDNHAAIALYSANGFAQTASRKGYYVRPNAQSVDALIMSRDLTHG